MIGHLCDSKTLMLRDFALIDRETISDERDAAIRTECIRLHRLVRQVAMARRDHAMREDQRRTLVEVLAAVCPQEIYHNPQGWPRARRLDALALSLAGDEAALALGMEAQAAS